MGIAACITNSIGGGLLCWRLLLLLRYCVAPCLLQHVRETDLNNGKPSREVIHGPCEVRIRGLLRPCERYEVERRNRWAEAGLRGHRCQ